MGCSNSTEKSPKARRKSKSPHEHPDRCVNPEIRITRSDSTSSSSSSSSSSDSSKSRGSKKDKRIKKQRKKSKKGRKKNKDSSSEREKQNQNDPPICENDPDDKPIVCVRRPEDRLPELELTVEKQEVIACDLQPEPETNNTEETTPCKEDEAQPESDRKGEGNDTKPESDTEAKPEFSDGGQ